MANTTMFESYEAEYCNLSQSISRKVGQIPQLSGERKKVVMQEAEREVEEADTTLSQMDLEARSLPASVRNRVMGRMKNYKSDFGRLKGDLGRAGAALPNQSFSTQKDELFSGIQHDLEVTSLDQRSRLLQNTNKLEESGNRIKESHQVVVQTEELGANILGDLHRQRGTIERSRDGLHTADGNISRSRRILGAMGRRVMTNKLILALIIVVLVGLIGLVIYLRWFNNNSGGGGGSK